MIPYKTSIPPDYGGYNKYYEKYYVNLFNSVICLLATVLNNLAHICKKCVERL